MNVERSRSYGPDHYLADRDGMHRGHGPMTEEMTVKRDEAIKRAGEVLADAAIACLQMTPREQAEAAWTPTSPYSVAELEELIRSERGLPPLDRSEGQS